MLMPTTSFEPNIESGEAREECSRQESPMHAVKRDGAARDGANGRADILWFGPEGGRVPAEMEAIIRRRLGRGSPLEPALREQMSLGLSFDFRGVHIHTGREADLLCRRLSARAFTVGSDIFFRDNAYEACSPHGRKLIAHELVHVVQQETGQVCGRGNGLFVRSSDDPFEREADLRASDFLRGRRWQRPLDGDLAGAAPRVGHHRRRPLVIQRTAQTFAGYAKHAPVPANGAVHIYTCHMAAMHWAFQELGDSQATAGARVEAIASAKCHSCQSGGNVHVNIPHGWYGTNLCAGAIAIPDQASLRANAAVGDVIVVGPQAAPLHSMVVVQIRSFFGKYWIYIRGLNNTNTLGKGLYLQYDGCDRDIDKSKYWHTDAQTGVTHFGQTFGMGGDMSRIPYATYCASAATVRNNCNNAAGTWTYTGP